MGQAKIGLIGLAVMGANLARNLAGKQMLSDMTELRAFS